MPSDLVQDYLSTLWNVVDNPSSNETFLREGVGFGEDDQDERTNLETLALILSVIIVDDIYFIAFGNETEANHKESLDTALKQLDALAQEFDVPDLSLPLNLSEDEFYEYDLGEIETLAEKIIQSLSEENVGLHLTGIQQILNGEY